MKMNKKGFTIVELVIVIAVIAILAGVMIPTFGNVIDSANKTAAQQEATNVYKQMCAKKENIELGSAFTDAKFYIVINKYEKFVFVVEDGAVRDAIKTVNNEEVAMVVKDVTDAGYTTEAAKTYGTYAGATIYAKPAA